MLINIRIILTVAQKSPKKWGTRKEKSMGRKKMSEIGPKRRPGRPILAEPGWVLDAANTYGLWFRQYWPKIGSRLLAATSAENIAETVRQETPDISANLAPFSPLMLKILRDRRFPQVRTEAQIQFLADSLGAQGIVTPRRSREICAKERNKVKHVILRREFYIECSCGYNGPALDGTCRDCGTAALSQDLLMREDDV